MWKIKTIGFFIFFCLSLVFSFASSSSVSAVSDLTYTYDFSDPSPIILCDISTPCSSYKYLVVERNFDYSLTTNSIGLTAQRSTGQQVFNYNLNFYFSYFIIDISQYSSLTNFNRLVFGSSVNGSLSSGTYSLTLTDKTPTFGTPEPCPVCPAIPDNPYDAKFDQVTRAIYTCGAILLVLYFFYCIYRIIIKNGGSR